MPDTDSRQPLRSWKDIATYLGCDQRTAQRWEKDRGLPIHHLTGKRGPVYAYKAEIDSWLTQTGLPKSTGESSKADIQREAVFLATTAKAIRPGGKATECLGRFNRFLPADHVWHVVTSCLIYASLYAVALIVEVVYDSDHLWLMAVKATIGIFFWILAASLIGLTLDFRLTKTGNRAAFGAALSVLILSAGLAYLVLRPFLPDSSSVVAGFQTFTAQAAYLKDICYFLLLVCIFWLPTFHFVVSLEREMRAGKQSSCLALLLDDKSAAQPSGAIYPRPRIVLGLWLAVVGLGIFMLFHLFDNLKPSPHKNLFMQLVLLRTILYFAFGTECLVWYYRAREELKRKCQVVSEAQ